MRNAVILLAMLLLHFNSYGQKKKVRQNPIPVVPPAVIQPDTLSLYEGKMPSVFVWEMNADVTLKPGTDFKEVINLTYGETEVKSLYSQQVVKLKKTKSSSGLSAPDVPKVITRLNYYQVNLANGIVTLKERDRIVMRLKVLYGKDKWVSALQDLGSKRIYKYIDAGPGVIEITH